MPLDNRCRGECGSTFARLAVASRLAIAAVAVGCFTLLPPAASASIHSVPLPPWIAQMEAWPGNAANPAENSGPLQQAMASMEIEHMLSHMASSGERLTSVHAGSVTQTIQRRIIHSLNALIAQAEQAQSSSSGGKKKSHQHENSSMAMSQTGQQPSGPTNTPSHAAHHSYVPPGEGLHPGHMSAFHSNKRQWGNLPPRARNMILNAMHKQSLPQYRALVNQYYKRLAQMASPTGH